MEQQRLAHLFDHDNDAGSACRDALLAGTELILWQDAASRIAS